MKKHNQSSCINTPALRCATRSLRGRMLSAFAGLTLGSALLASIAQADSLFTQPAGSNDRGSTLIADRVTRFEVGDIITVMVRERIDASTQADTNTKKETEVSSVAPIARNPFLTTSKYEDGLGIMKPEELPNWQGETENETKNRGTTTRESTLTTTVACLVTQVLPNGNLIVQGERKVTVNREDSTLVISGLVRSKDVKPDNTILSTQMANAQIQLKGKGELWNNQRRGLMTKITDWINPF